MLFLYVGFEKKLNKKGIFITKYKIKETSIKGKKEKQIILYLTNGEKKYYDYHESSIELIQEAMERQPKRLTKTIVQKNKKIILCDLIALFALVALIIFSFGIFSIPGIVFALSIMGICTKGVIENVKIMKGAQMFELVSQNKDKINQGLEDNKNNEKMFDGITDQTTNYLKDNRIDFSSIDSLNLRDLRVLLKFINKQKESEELNKNLVNFGDVFVSGEALGKIEKQPEQPQKVLKKADTFKLTSNQCINRKSKCPVRA